MWLVRFLALSACFLLLACGDDTSTPKDSDTAVTDTAVPDTATPDEDTATGDDAFLEDGDELLTDVDTYIDPEGDADGDGIPNGVEDTTNNDRDSDGIPNYLDTDSDGDGILDSEECPAQPCKNSDHDNYPDYLDRDSDNDGLTDMEETLMLECTDPYLKDTDGDGTDDLSEFVYQQEYQPDSADPCDPALNVPDGIIFAYLPRMSPEEITRRITVTIPDGTVDVAFVLDGSASTEMARTQMLAEIQDKIVAPLSAEFPNATFGAAQFGWAPAYTRLSGVTTDTEAFLAALDGWSAPDDGALQSLGLFLAASGAAIYDTVEYCIPSFDGCNQTVRPDSEISYDAVSCTDGEGTLGGLCFREKARPVFVMVTDEPFSKCYRSDETVPVDEVACFYKEGAGVRLPEAIAAMSACGARFIGIDTGFEETAGDPPTYTLTDAATADFTAIAQATGSLDTQKEPFIFHTANSDGSGLPVEVIDAIKALAVPITTDVTIAAGAGGDTCDEEAIAGVLQDVEAIAAEPTNGITGADETTFFGAKSGTRLTFDITLYNEFCNNNGTGTLFLRFPLTILGNGEIIGTYLVIVGIPQLE